jgi:dolichol-phosphate mannosyltransferase
MKRLSIVFSFRNEEETLYTLIGRTVATLRRLPYDYEIIFVNDASTDCSLEILLRERENNPRIKILNMSRRFGIHPCVMAGLNAARGDAVVYMDSDLQDPPEMIEQLVAEWQRGADIVHTKRRKRLGEHWLKMAITKLAYRVIDLLSDVRIPSNCGDFKLLSRKALNELLKLQEKNPFMRGLTYWIGFRQVFVEYDRQPRYRGKTHFSMFTLGPMKEFERGVITFSTIPLKISLILGFLASSGSFLYLPFLIAGKWLGWNLPGWTGIMSAIAFLNGLVLFTIGVTGLYIARIYDEVRGRPSYIIADRWGFEDVAPHLTQESVYQ